MKKLYLLILPIALLVLGGAVFFNEPTVQRAEATFSTPEYPNPKDPICEDGQVTIEDNQKFSLKVGQVNVSYRWHIQSQDATSVTYRLQVDINPTNNETWVNVGGNITRTVDVPECVEVTPTPTPTPTEQPKEQTSAPAEAKAPVCPDGNTINLPANPHVLRNGESATVNWFQTEGDSANIYYKEVNASDWQHSVNDVRVNSEKFGSVTIHGLNPSLGYTFGIQQKKGCGGGQTVTAVIIDGPAPVLFYFSYWEWDN